MDALSPPSPRSNIRELAIRYHQEGRFAEALKAYRIAILLFPKDTILTYNLGNLFRATGQNQKAIACYELVLRFKADDLSTLTNLAPLYRSGGQREKAVATYERILSLQPHNKTARYFLDALQGSCPERSPDGYVQELFDRYSETFDQHIVSTLKYKTPSLLRQLLSDDPEAPLQYASALDLGCGTGLSAEAFQACSPYWVGVDLSAGMLEKAYAKGLYRELHTAEILNFLEKEERRFPLILMADVVPYFGDLTLLLDSLKKCLTPGGYLLFSTEEGPRDVQLQLCGRFTHSSAYIHRLAEQTGLTLSRHRLETARMQAGEPVVAGLYSFRGET